MMAVVRPRWVLLPSYIMYFNSNGVIVGAGQMATAEEDSRVPVVTGIPGLLVSFLLDVKAVCLG